MFVVLILITLYIILWASFFFFQGENVILLSFIYPILLYTDV